MLRLLSFLVGPVFAKEMVEMARRKRYYLNRVLYGAVLLFTLFVVWKNHQWQFEQYGPSIRVMARMAESLFHAVSSVQYGAVFLFVPLFLCGVIASEREERTLEMLFTTQLTDREIVLGKLISRVAVLVMLILCGLPIMSVIMFFGGIDPASLWRVLASTLLAILVTGAVAIYFSAITRSPMGALVRTYFWLAIWLLAVPLTCALLLEGSRPGPNSPAVRLFLGGMMLLHPVMPFIVALDTMIYNQVVNVVGPWGYPLAFVVPGGLSLGLIWRAIRRLRLPPTAFGRFWAALSPWRRIRQAFGGAGRSPGRRFRPERLLFALPVGNPLWLRARRARVYDREGYIGRIQWLGWFAAAFFLVLVALVDPRSFRHSELSMTFLVPGWIGVAALAVIFSANSLVGDRRRGFLELVLLTPLTPRQVIDGTFLAVWQHWRRAFWLPCLLGLLLLLFTPLTPAGLFFSVTTATLFCTLLLFHGIACSLTARTVPAALVAAFLFPLLVNVGVVFLMPMFEQGAGPVLWFLMVPFLVGSWFWMRRRPSLAGVACYFMAVHLVIAQLAVFWTWSGWHTRSRSEYPIAAMHPAFLTVTTLARPNEWLDSHPDAVAILLCYWTALVVNILWARGWLIRNFEWLVERTGAPAAAPGRSRSHHGHLTEKPLLVPVRTSPGSKDHQASLADLRPRL
jgi:ABC-type transport system involved in multi-copper enzyme maturation permease subunit